MLHVDFGVERLVIAIMTLGNGCNTFSEKALSILPHEAKALLELFCLWPNKIR